MNKSNLFALLHVQCNNYHDKGSYKTTDQKFAMDNITTLLYNVQSISDD